MFTCMLYFESNQGRQVYRTALCWPHIYSGILQNASFCTHNFKIFFASGGKGALTPIAKILRTFLRPFLPLFLSLLFLPLCRVFAFDIRHIGLPCTNAVECMSEIRPNLKLIY